MRLVAERFEDADFAELDDDATAAARDRRATGRALALLRAVVLRERAEVDDTVVRVAMVMGLLLTEPNESNPHASSTRLHTHHVSDPGISIVSTLRKRVLARPLSSMRGFPIHSRTRKTCIEKRFPDLRDRPKSPVVGECIH